jgi:hypothetical protein
MGGMGWMGWMGGMGGMYLSFNEIDLNFDWTIHM